MVRIIGYNQRKAADGRTFIVLELEGSLQVQKSQSGNLYACVSKCNLPCSFDEFTAKEMIGSTLPGTIERVDCEPYHFINPITQETVTLAFRNIYKMPENNLSGFANHQLNVVESEVL